MYNHFEKLFGGFSKRCGHVCFQQPSSEQPKVNKQKFPLRDVQIKKLQSIYTMKYWKSDLQTPEGKEWFNESIYLPFFL